MEKEITNLSWMKRWAGSYTFVSCSYWGKQYYSVLKRDLGIGFAHSLFLHKKGVVSFYISNDEYELFGKKMAEETIADPEKAKNRLKELKENSDRLNKIMKVLADKIPSWDEYQNFLVYLERQLPLHNFMKKTVDFIPADKLDELMPYFKDARVYSENVYSNTESFFRSLAGIIAEKENYSADFLTCLTQEELESYLNHGKLPSADILESRYVESALYFKEAEPTILLGKESESLEDKITNNSAENTQMIKGMCGFPGKITGTARIVLDPLTASRFDEGDILITGMTRPEFVMLATKASAIITDAGGMLCHAAITAREMKKPCIIGTEIATKVLKDGQMIEVDADKGIVKII